MQKTQKKILIFYPYNLKAIDQQSVMEMLVKNNPFLYVQIVMSKAGVILFYIIVFFNIGIYYLYKSKFNSETMIFFVTGIIFNSLFGLATEPNYTYLLGLFAYSSLFTTKLIEDDFAKSS